MSRGPLISFDKCVAFGNGRVNFYHNRADKMLRLSATSVRFRTTTAISLPLCRTTKAAYRCHEGTGMFNETKEMLDNQSR